MRRFALTVMLALAFFAALGACGTKGPLTLPTADDDPRAARRNR